MKEKLLIPFCLLLFCVGCSNTEHIEKFPKVPNKYDPSRPNEVVSMTPLTGRIDDNFIIEGNFGMDLSEIEVYFEERKAVLLRTDGQTLHGIVPKQPNGDNPITVVLGDQVVETDITFRYRQVQYVTTAVGDYEKRQAYNTDFDSAEGPLAEQPFGFIVGLTVLADGNIFVNDHWPSCTYLVSFEDNKVVRLTGHWQETYGNGATSNNGEIAYLLEVNDQKLHQFKREDGWARKELRNNTPELTGKVYSCTFGDDERYLYARDSHGIFGRYDLEAEGYPFEVLLVAEGGSENWTRLCYSKYSDCFYATQPDRSAIYKIWQDKTTQEWKIELYAGLNGAGFAEGHRLTDAQFNFPIGICADNLGNVYVTNRQNHTVFKIVEKTGRVEHVAGVKDDAAEPPRTGKPLESTFREPNTIVMDQDENFYISGEGQFVVQKYSIE